MCMPVLLNLYILSSKIGISDHNNDHMAHRYKFITLSNIAVTHKVDDCSIRGY